VRAFARFSVITALVLSLGLHWALLQTVAWTGMIVSYSLEENLSGAVAKTFDGQHPCCMCKAIQKGKSEERKRDDQQLVSKGKLDLGLVWTQAAFVFTPLPCSPVSTIETLSSRAESPQEPPPRRV
jgi:hypothetical protein